MGSRTLFFILVVAVAVSLLGLLMFGFEGGLGGRGHGMGEVVPQSFWLVMFVAPLVVVVAVLGYVLMFPEFAGGKFEQESSFRPTVEKDETALDAVLRVLNEDERKVMEALVSEGGTMMQKDIRWKTSLSRVKVHRILFRLAKRGIVSAEKHYNTNKITLADWLTGQKGSAK